MANRQLASFEVDREVLLRALQRAQSIVDRKNTIPILSHILIEGNDEQLVFSATDLEVGLRCSFPAKINQPGKVAVPAKSLYEIVKELPTNSLVRLKIFENFWIELTSGKSFFKLVGQDSDEFPQLPQVQTENIFSVPTEKIIQMVEHTVFAVSMDQTRYDLSGVFLEQIKSKGKTYLRMVATDGHRLSMMDQEIESPKEAPMSRGVILPKKGLYELKRVLSDDSMLYCCFLENNVVFWNSQRQTTLFMRLLDGEFPDYTPVIPKNNDLKIILGREQLYNSLKRISILTEEHSRSVRFQFDKGKLRLSSSNPKLGEASEDLDIDYGGDVLEIGFNAGYLMDILSALQNQQSVVIEMTDILSPSIVRGRDFDGAINIVMPMQLGSEVQA